MKSNSPGAPASRDTPASLTGVSEKRSRRSLAEAASHLARSMVEGTLGGAPLGRGARGPAASSAAASVHRLRKVLERDRATFAAQEPAIPEASAGARSERDEHVTALDAEPFGEPTRVCKTRGPRALPVAARTQRPGAVLRAPPPRRADLVEFAVDEQDEEGWLSVHGEPPQKVRPPAAVTDRADARASALAAAAASAFGTTSASGSPRGH